jgi:penicillin-binding protein 1C
MSWRRKIWMEGLLPPGEGAQRADEGTSKSETPSPYPLPKGEGRKTRRRWRVVMVAVLLLGAIRLFPHAPLSSRIPVSTAVWSADGELLRVTLASDEQYRLWTPLSKMSPEVVDAFLLKEDRWFRWHPGVNPVSLFRGAYRSYSGGMRQGGSTLTMQLARLLGHLNTRSPLGKTRQILAALWLEARYSKRELLEAYLNVAPFGGNISGVEAASRIYFDKPASQVNLSEALTLAVIPQSPSTRAGRSVRDGTLLAARTQLGSMWLANRGDAERRQIELPILTDSRFSLPYQAPHFVDALLASRGRTATRLDTTLNASMQHLLERQIDRYLGQYGDRGIRNVSALLVDTRDMAVKAWVGSADYWNESIDGQVNGVLAKRSPGSTLKPFIYALAMDQGILHPRTMLRDAPTAFGPFSPENFDGQFFGPISAQEALIRSRNVPAMVVASQLKQPSLYQFLKSAGVSRMQSESHYGLALVLGGGEVTMEELASMYAMLANQGMLRPVRVENSDKPSEGVRLLSPEASFVTLDMLTHNPRPDQDGTFQSRARWPVAWKTGTSWGFRDAWSAGVVGPYVLVVWIGNFEGQGNPSFIGVDAAAPLFFRIVDALNWDYSQENVKSLAPPKGVSKVAVCSASGDLPNAWCPQTIETWYIPGKSPIRVSQLHRAVAVDSQTGAAICPPYPAGTRFDVFELWPSDMLKLFREAGVPRRLPPPLPSCAEDDPADAPRIASPLRGVSYALNRGKQTIQLEAGVAGDVRNLFWFDGRALIGRVAASDRPMEWRPQSEGVHILRVIDDHGRSAEREVYVQLAQ